MRNNPLFKMRARSLATVLAIPVIAAVGLAGCSASSGATNNTSGGNASTNYAATPVQLTDQQKSAILQKAFLTPSIKESDLDSTTAQALYEVGQDYTPEQVAKAWECQTQPTCKLGDGPLTIAILDGSGSNQWRHLSHASIMLQATGYPGIGTILSLDSNGDLQTMQAQLQTLIARHVDGIIAVDDFGPAMTPSFTQAKAAGIPVVTYAQGPGTDAADLLVTQVQTDFCDDGKQMAIATKDLIGSSGSVAFFTGTPGNPQGAGWEKCAEDWFSQNAPGITVASKSNTSWSEAGTVSATSALIASGNEVSAVLYDYALQTKNIVQSYQAAHLKVPAQVTWTSDNGLLKMWEDGQKSSDPWGLAYTSSINYEGSIAFTALLNHLAGKSVPNIINFPLPFTSAKQGDYVAGLADNAPGPTLMPDELLKKVLNQ
jgi:ABC-type sugar transport system substrate-binding protein